MLYVFVLGVIVFAVISISSGIERVANKPFNFEERDLISFADSTMRVLTVADSLDNIVLRTPCENLSEDELKSPLYSRLCELMIATVTSPEQDGVGIAGPQVGLSRRVVAVQRFDKENEPFEVYANIQIDSLFGEQVYGLEGCLSIPGQRGNVLRHQSVAISYDALISDAVQTLRDTIHGFTAVIFQHEIDHLAGILYTDRTDEIIYED